MDRRLEPTAATDSDCSRAETGELRLISAVLALAIADARRDDVDAQRWIASDESGPAVGGFNFVDICEALALDASWARAQVAAGGVGRRRARAVVGSGRTEVRPARRKVA